MAHIINEGDRWFLNMHRKDPLLHQEFRPGDSVVVCRACRTVQTNDTWTFNGGKCIVCGNPDGSGAFTRQNIDPNYVRKIKINKKTGAKTAAGTAAGRPASRPSYSTSSARSTGWFSEQSIRKRRTAILGLMALICAAMICFMAYYQIRNSNNFWPAVPLGLWNFYSKRAAVKLAHVFGKIKTLHVLKKMDIARKLKKLESRMQWLLLWIKSFF